MSDMRMRPDQSSGYLGRTYKFYQGENVFEFGHGLSYSNYSYSFVYIGQKDLHFETLASDKKPEELGYVAVSDLDSYSCKNARFSTIVGIENGGEMAGKHPVLLFLRRGQGRSDGPIKQLVGFQTVRLNANEKGSVEFELNPCEQFGIGDEDGEIVIELGQQFLVVGDQEFSISINV